MCLRVGREEALRLCGIVLSISLLYSAVRMPKRNSFYADALPTKKECLYLHHVNGDLASEPTWLVVIRYIFMPLWQKKLVVI